MGGRGSSSGFSDSGAEYGTEFHELYKTGNIKFVQSNKGSATAPMETMTRGRVYVTVNADGVPKFISYYDTQNKRSKTIDLGHKHKGVDRHVHHGYFHNENDGPKGATNPDTKEKRMIEKALKAWYNRPGK